MRPGQAMTDLPSFLHPRTRRFEKIWNTYVRVSLPWKRTLGATYWEKRARDASHGANQYVELQESSHVLIDEVVSLASGPDAPILDLGCNVGRHLDALYSRGFKNLHGIDVQRAALEHMKEVFSAMSAMAHIQQGSFQDCLPHVPDAFFEVVFTHGATVELVRPSFPICPHIARVSSKAVIMVIDENGHAYPRFWETEFRRVGFLLTKLLRPISPTSLNSLLVFQRMTS